jgi:tetratricopeptide (TPR) repeat protein
MRGAAAKRGRGGEFGLSGTTGSSLASQAQLETVFASVVAALQEGDEARAMRLAERAVFAGLEHPLVFNLAAAAHEKRHEYARAVALLEQGLGLAPNDVDLLTALGLCLNKLRQTDRAVSVFEAVLRQRPDFAPAHYGLGVAAARRSDFQATRQRFETAAALMPGYADPIGALAGLEAQLGDTAAAAAAAKRALAIDPRQAAARTALAICEVDAKRFDAAETLARELVDDSEIAEEDRAAAGLVLGDALDGQGRAGEAFAAYVAAKGRWRATCAAEFERPGQETYAAFLTRLYRWFSALGPEAWAPNAGADRGPAAGHVFVVGFARSGTTLLETALGSHTAIASLDEGDCLRTAAGEAMNSAESLDLLSRLEPEIAMRWRSAYWNRVAECGVNVQGKVFVDKSPFGAPLLPLVSALFPDAKILFAVRDPRDVVLSCFRRNFNINPSTYEFTTLERTARCYDSVMSLAKLYRERFPLALRETKYEQVAQDFENEMLGVMEFLELDWNPAVLEFAKTAKNRPSRTPSARQLVRGLYSGEGQWRAYSEELEPVLPVLQPWLDWFGYE